MLSSVYEGIFTPEIEKLSLPIDLKKLQSQEAVRWEQPALEEIPNMTEWASQEPTEAAQAALKFYC